MASNDACACGSTLKRMMGAPWLRVVALLLAACATPAMRAQFTMQDSGTTADLRGIVNVGNGTAWASGTHGTVLRTEDSGFVWQGCTVPPGAEKLDFRGVQAFDDQTALVMSSGKGDLSRVYKTTDGCKSWKLVFTNPDAEGFFDAMQKMTRDKLYVLGDPVHGEFSIFSSSDGGLTWTAEHAVGLAADPMQQGAFAASNSSLIAAGLAHFDFATGGREGAFLYERGSVLSLAGTGAASARQSEQHDWSRTPVPVGNGQKQTAGVFSLAEDVRSGTLVAVGGDYAKPDSAERIAGSRSGGTGQWTAAQTMPHGYRSSVAYDAEAKAWITVGPNGTDVSTDDGRNWRALRPGYGDDPDADKHWNALSLPYVVGPHGRIGRLRDDALAGAKTAH